MPEEVHFDVKKHELKDIIGNADIRTKVDASKWLTELWKQKEERLKKYYDDKSSGRPPRLAPSGDAYVWPVYFKIFLQLIHFLG